MSQYTDCMYDNDVELVTYEEFMKRNFTVTDEQHYKNLELQHKLDAANKVGLFADNTQITWENFGFNERDIKNVM